MNLNVQEEDDAWIQMFKKGFHVNCAFSFIFQPLEERIIIIDRMEYLYVKCWIFNKKIDYE